MKKLFKVIILTMLMLASTAVNGYSQESSKVQTAVSELVRKYDGKPGVTCMTAEKGSGLGMLKMILKDEFGKSFLKGVTRITLIIYAEASQEICDSIHKDMDIFLSMLEEFPLGNEEEFADNQYIRCFAAENGAGRLSDFVSAIEDKDMRCLVYMSGDIDIED